MKNIISIAIIAAMLVGCTENMMTRSYGGKSEIKLEKGQRLVEMTWKSDNLWILTEPMDSDYTPQIKTFYESSNFGLMEGK